MCFKFSIYVFVILEFKCYIFGSKCIFLCFCKLYVIFRGYIVGGLIVMMFIMVYCNIFIFIVIFDIKEGELL